MTCDEIRDLMPDLAAGISAATPEVSGHLRACADCTAKLEEFRQTMALLDEWQAPEPSPYFDTRLQARLREEMARPQGGWMQWLRRPMLAAALTVLLGVGIGTFFVRGGGMRNSGGSPVASMDVQPGTAVSDLQALDKNQQLYSDFELLDDLEVQQDVGANQ
jgi:predicted anti-sigma-YlaC factor YlaD